MLWTNPPGAEGALRWVLLLTVALLLLLRVVTPPEKLLRRPPPKDTEGSGRWCFCPKRAGAARE